MFHFPECFQTSAVRGLLLFYISVQPEEANTTTVNFCALSLYYVITITYVVLILLHGSCTKRYNIVKDNYSYKTAPLKRRENSLQSPIYFSGIMLKCMH